MKPLCIFHASCFDGFTAAWVVHRFYCDRYVDLFPAIYGQPPPDVAGRQVILVDFSYKRDVMERLVADAESVLVLDHHKTAEADLRDLKGAAVIFDMERSGAGIAWDYFFPDDERPWLVDYVEDRDLWRFALLESRFINEAIGSYDFTLNDWDCLAARDLGSLVSEGRALDRKHWRDIRTLIPIVERTMVIGGVAVPVANLPMTLASDAGTKLSEGLPFAACYFDTPQGRVVSLRSDAKTDCAVDVSEIAKRYGGGGHKHAAGFTMPHGWEGDGA